MELKRYQTDALDVLRRFLEEARLSGPSRAYEAVTRQPEQAGRLGRYGGAYRRLVGLPEAPYVCLRLPTGGGKTVLAAHAVAVVRDAWIEKDWPMTLWLVPTKTIRQQTAEALKNRRHPYRRVLDDAFDGRVRVFDIGDFPYIRPHDIRGHCCVVVATIQTLRVTNTEGRKVYAHNENLEPHFTQIEGTPAELEASQGGGPRFSFANLMHLHRPLMIVDEAHNAVTGLTREMQARVNPCAIVEFTATPRPNSNILHSVTASELKAEEMVKLPVMLSEHDTWQNAVNGAVATRRALAEAAAEDPDQIRPIVMFQAQKRNEEVTVAALKRHLIEVERIPEHRIAVATGDQRELDGINLFDADCPIEHVITVEALKEGWDCSFAYVFCSVSRIQSAVDVEQLLGRVLRMPYARRRKADELNKAYAHLSEPSFGAAARALVDKLVKMGFDEDEARDSIREARAKLGTDGELFSTRELSKPTFRHTVTVAPDLLPDLRAHEAVTVRENQSGTAELVVVGHFDTALETAIAESLSRTERTEFARAVAGYRVETRDRLSPAERGETFSVPRLMSRTEDALQCADTDVFMEDHDWSLLDHSSDLGEAEFRVRATSRSFEIDLDGNRVSYQFTAETRQLPMEARVDGWTPDALVLWLDRQVRQMDIAQGEMLGWLRRLVEHLTVARGIPIAALMRCKYLLARKVRQKIAAIRQRERNAVYQRHLFAPQANTEVSFDHAFVFEDGMYLDQRRYRGRWKPRRHFLGRDRVPAFDGAEDGEEVRCAQTIDSLPGVKFWIRNVARHPASFWLPTASGKFYPDFVGMLEDGRSVVVEYKGSHIVEGSDTAGKRAVGELWECKSDGKCVFVLAEELVDGADTRAQILSRIGRRSA